MTLQTRLLAARTSHNRILIRSLSIKEGSLANLNFPRLAPPRYSRGTKQQTIERCWKCFLASVLSLLHRFINIPKCHLSTQLQATDDPFRTRLRSFQQHQDAHHLLTQRNACPLHGLDSGKQSPISSAVRQRWQERKKE